MGEPLPSHPTLLPQSKTYLTQLVEAVLADMDTINQTPKSGMEHAPLDGRTSPSIAKGETTVSTADEAISEAEPQKTYYSKQSVWLMVLFSGLAIGSDG